MDSVGVENCHLPLTKPVAVNTGLALPRARDNRYRTSIASRDKNLVDICVGRARSLKTVPFDRRRNLLVFVPACRKKFSVALMRSA